MTWDCIIIRQGKERGYFSMGDVVERCLLRLDYWVVVEMRTFFCFFLEFNGWKMEGVWRYGRGGGFRGMVSVDLLKVSYRVCFL